jgi:hypothetical protein
MYLCMCIYIYKYTCMYIYIHLYVYISIHINAHVYIGAQKLSKGDIIKETERILENDRKVAQGVRCVLICKYLYVNIHSSFTSYPLFLFCTPHQSL